jgi:hypothetical protein
MHNLTQHNLTQFFFATIAALLPTTSVMKTTRLLKLSLAASALLFCAVIDSSAQILYSQLTSFNPPRSRFQLRQVNGDGSGDIPVGLPFASVSLPVWSRDGGLFAVTASDPNRPNDLGSNVYTINAATGAIGQITFFQDLPPDSGTGTFSYHLPLFKAFSPDRSALAVSRYFVNGSGFGTGGATPVLEVYSTVARVNPIQVHVHRDRTNTHHGLEGVDWSPFKTCS